MKFSISIQPSSRFWPLDVSMAKTRRRNMSKSIYFDMFRNVSMSAQIQSYLSKSLMLGRFG